ncbi:MAG: DinB family protein [Candidatus Velamenicoccus archaeovorus]
MDPTIAAARDLFEEAFEQLRDAVAATPADALNRRPAGEDTNAIAVLATHAMEAARMWIACALGEPLPRRDRPAEFRTRAATTQELLERVDAVAEACRALLETASAFDPGAEREEPPTSPGAPPTGERITAAWALIHAVEHLREHAGQAALTRQLVVGS